VEDIVVSELHLFDVSQYISSGVQDYTIGSGVEQVDGVFRAMEMPCAGITNLLNTYNAYGGKQGVTVLFCFDSIPVYKRELHSRLFPELGGYKGNRKTRPVHISVQREMAVEIFDQIGIPYLKVDGYEADDLIASVVQEYSQQFDRVVIHSRDSDLFYLVSENVCIEPVLRTGKRINLSNWESTVLSGYRMPYNMLTISKMREGEVGDNIPYVYRDPMDAIIRGIPERQRSKCGDNVFLREYIVDTVGKEDTRTLGIFDLIAPLIVPREELVLYEDEHDDHLLEMYASGCSCSGYRSNCPVFSEEVEKMVRKYVLIYMEQTR